MKDLTEVTKELTEVFAKVIKGDLPVDQANTAINTADKIIKATVARCKYYGMRDQVPFVK